MDTAFPQGSCDLHTPTTQDVMPTPEIQGGSSAEQKLLSPARTDDKLVSPDEVLALGALALAGLWPGSWCGIAAIIVHQVHKLAQRGAADTPFRQCAMSLVDMLLKSPGDPRVAEETWQHLAGAQARLPPELAGVLGLSCALLQSRTVEAADLRARRKRRRMSSVEAVSTISAPTLPFASPCATPLVLILDDMEQEHEEEDGEDEEDEEDEELHEEQVHSGVGHGGDDDDEEDAEELGRAAHDVNVDDNDKVGGGSGMEQEPVWFTPVLEQQQPVPRTPPHYIPPLRHSPMVAECSQNGICWANAAENGPAGVSPVVTTPAPLTPPTSEQRPFDWSFGTGGHGSYQPPGGIAYTVSPPRQVEGGATEADTRLFAIDEHTTESASSFT